MLLPEVAIRFWLVSRARCASFAFAILLAGCSPGEVGLFTPGTAGDGVGRPTLRVAVRVDPADSALARTLNWNAGVPGAGVHVNQVGTLEWTMVTTDAAGVAEFLLPPGLKRVFAGRIVRGDEAEIVGGVPMAFGDGATGGRELALFGHRGGGLLISEIGTGKPLPWETNGSYPDAMYFEVFNAADSVMYLDGVLFSIAFHVYRATATASCEERAAFRLDSLGVYAFALLRFPGTGAEHPIAPGQAHVVAVAAIDHRPVHATLPDLRDATFEVGGVGGADNPAVPNMIQEGTVGFFPSFLNATGKVYALAAPLDVAALPRFQDPLAPVYRIPAEAVLDVVALDAVSESDLEFPPCSPMLHPRFERYEGGFKPISEAKPEDAYLSHQRKVLRVDSAGYPVLFNTNTSAVDFFIGQRTPGWLPEVGEGWSYPAGSSARR